VKRPKAQRRAPTQDELLKRAQETEERNVIEHRDYLKTEDEKRQRARLVRPAIEGRLVRWVNYVLVFNVLFHEDTYGEVLRSTSTCEGAFGV
jgi:hypothetical protein